jgi:hypothetical protein
MPVRPGASGDGAIPIIKEPGKDCYCMNSNKIPFALRFCGERFDGCGVYQSAMLGELHPDEKCELH